MSSIVNHYRAYLAQSLEAGTAASTIYVDRITTITGETVATSDFADFSRGILTVNPEGDGNSDYPEQVSFTAVSSSDLSFTGAIRGLNKSGTTTTSLMRYHPVGTPVIISIGTHNLQDIKSYIDGLIAVAAIGTANVVAGTAGETLVAGNLVYLKNDGKWWKADADLTTTIDAVILGIAQGAGAANGAITNGVMLKGLDTNQSGLVAGTTYYVSNTAGAIETSAGTNTKIIGVGRSSTSIYFDPVYGNLPTSSEKSMISLMTGIIFDYAGSSIPSGWLDCDGSAVSRTTYAALFTAIGTTWGVGNGSTTFNLPDLRGRYTVGAGTGTKVATFASRSSNVITVTGLTNAANNEFQTGQAVLYTAASGAMTGLTHNTTYYVIRTGNLTFSLATTLALAQAGTAIALSSDGTGTQTFTKTFTTRTLGDTGGEETHAMSSSEILAHVHNPGGLNYTFQNNGGTRFNTTGGGGDYYAAGTTESYGGNAAMNVVSPFGSVKKIIKT